MRTRSENITATDAYDLVREAKQGYLHQASDTFLMHLEARLLTWAEECRSELKRRIAIESAKHASMAGCRD